MQACHFYMPIVVPRSAVVALDVRKRSALNIDVRQKFHQRYFHLARPTPNAKVPVAGFNLAVAHSIGTSA